MTKAIKKAKDFKEEVIQELKKEEGQTWQSIMRVMRWIVDGKPQGLILEKISLFKKKEGGFSERGKRMGLSLKDCEFIVENWPEIKMFFDAKD